MANAKVKGLSSDSARSWSQIVQGVRRFYWESTRVTTADIAAMEKRFSKVNTFSSDEVSHARHLLKYMLLGQFLGRGLLLEFIQKGLKLRWGLKGDLNISSLSEGVLFRL